MKLFGLFLTMLALLSLANCASRVSLGPVYLIYPEDLSIDIELKSYSFHPNHMVILHSKSRTLTIRLINTDQIIHNFTLIDSQKNILVTADAMPKEPTSVTVKSLDPGNYIFYCNRFLHHFRGMEGMLMTTE